MALLCCCKAAVIAYDAAHVTHQRSPCAAQLHLLIHAHGQILACFGLFEYIMSLASVHLHNCMQCVCVYCAIQMFNFVL